jgi:uncharacterized membrane protein YkgB
MNFLLSIDTFLITTFRKIAEPFARISLFIIYFWFGILKIFDVSAAIPLVRALMEKTFLIYFLTPEVFLVLFSCYEMAIGLSFLVPKLTRFSIVLTLAHMVMTVLPLFLLLDSTWQGFLTPTLEGQYIIKNLLIITAVIYIGSRLSPISKS